MTNGPDSWLVDFSYYAQFRTSVAVAGGRLAGGGPVVAGYPIGLSRATWHMAVSAVNIGNQNSPIDANISSTSNMSLWNSTMGIGGGVMPNPVPGANAAWTAAGDGVRCYLSWSTDMAAALYPSQANAMVSLAVPVYMESRHGNIRPASLRPTRAGFANIPLAAWHRPHVARQGGRMMATWFRAGYVDATAPAIV